MRTFLFEILPMVMMAVGVLTVLLWLASPVLFLGAALVVAGAGLLYWWYNKQSNTPLQGI